MGIWNKLESMGIGLVHGLGGKMKMR